MIMLSAIKLNVVMLNVVAPPKDKKLACFIQKNLTIEGQVAPLGCALGQAVWFFQGSNALAFSPVDNLSMKWSTT
jgi:hypothetical protein